MQNQYVGDVGDFGKYGLLRYLCGIYGTSGPILPLAVVWYLTPNEGGKAGKHVRYLDPQPRNLRRFRECDPALWDALSEVVYDGHYPAIKQDRRNVKAVEEVGIFPPDTVYYAAPLIVDGKAVDRTEWARDCVNRAKGRKVVFLDPDNGLEPKATAGPKHILLTELEPFLEGNQTVIIYHHLGRNCSHREQISERSNQLKTHPGTSSVIALRYRRGTSRAYFILPTAEHDGLIQDRVRALLRSAWGQNRHFVPVQ